ncbi:MAG: hypothetical protein J6X70_04080 [Muribaculaceae bacterium]|nr:hypothetical protein [Muribaculaceae bacterium]
MGLFDNAKQLTKLGNAVANVKNMLDGYENDPDVSFLIISAWICKVGITDMIEKNNWLPNYIVYVPINGHQTKMTMMEVQFATVSRLMRKVSQLYDDELECRIKDVLDGGPSFYELDAQLPSSIKDIIENPKFT